MNAGGKAVAGAEMECLGDASRVIIEVRTGNVPGRDDIERLHDGCGRS